MSVNERKLALLSGEPLVPSKTFPYDRPILSENALSYVESALRSGNWSLFTSPEVENFEREFGEFIGAKHVIMVNSCTTAILASCISFDLRSGSTILAPAYTYVGTCMPAVICQSRIMWADIDLSNHCIDCTHLDDHLRAGKIDAVLSPHLFGCYEGAAEVAAICRRHDVPVIFDFAQMLGNRVTTSAMAQAGLCCFSFGESKLLRIGEGGAVATNSGDLAERVRLFRHEGELWLRHSLSRIIGSSISPEDVLSQLASVRPGLNLRPPSMLAALARAQLLALDDLLEATARNAGLLSSGLTKLSGISLPHPRRVWWTFPILVTDESVDRDTLLAALMAEGIPAGIHFPRVLPQHPIFRDLDNGSGAYRNATYFADRHIVLPVYPLLSNTHLGYIASAFEQVFLSPMLRSEECKKAARAYLRSTNLADLSSGIYLFPAPQPDWEH